MIKPTIGRILQYIPLPTEPGIHYEDQPWAAIITCVRSDTQVNLAVFDAHGISMPRRDVFLAQDGGDAPPTHGYAKWPTTLGVSWATDRGLVPIEKRDPFDHDGDGKPGGSKPKHKATK